MFRDTELRFLAIFVASPLAVRYVIINDFVKTVLTNASRYDPLVRYRARRELLGVKTRALYIRDCIGVNINERKSGTDRTKKREKR